MSVFAIAMIGVAVVLIAILILKLHPLLALLLGSLFLLAATPQQVRLMREVRDHQLPIEALSGSLVGLRSLTNDGNYVLLDEENADSNLSLDVAQLREPHRQIMLSLADPMQIASTLRNQGLPASGLVWYAVRGNQPLTLRRTDRLVPRAALQSLDSSAWEGIGGQLADGFARTFRKLGIPVTMAAVVGVCLLESGAAARLVAALVGLFGPRGTAPALTLSGFVLGIPVYFDNVFYLLLPLAKAVGRRRPQFYLTAVMAIIVGATMAHSLVPPTPGPLLVASEIGVSIGKMMIGGLIVGGFAASIGFLYGTWCHRWVQLEGPPDSQPTSDASASAGGSARAGRKPIPLWLAGLPIFLPMLALGGSEVLEFSAGLELESSTWWRLRPRIEDLHATLSVFNDPSLIFIGTAILAIGILRYYSSQEVVARSVAKGISDAGTIVLLTCAGGAFGASLQQLGLAEAIGQRFQGLSTPWGILVTAFLLTTVIRAAQGSATVAMITSAAIIAPILQSSPLPFDKLYIALAIGCGSKPLPWMNDSGFWQVATMTGMNTSQTLKTFTVALTLMGLSGFAVVLLGAWLLPLV